MTTTNRSRWHKGKDGRPTISFGHHGYKVRLFENRNGVFYIDTWQDGQKVRQSLRTRTKSEAEQLAREVLRSRLSGLPQQVQSQPLTLGELWSLFSTQCESWKDNSTRSRKDDQRSSTVLIGYFGNSKIVSSFSRDDQVAFQNARLNGTIRVNGVQLKPVRARSVQADVILLHRLLRWATQTKRNNKPLLGTHPLQGVPTVREKNTLRPVADMTRFEKTRKALVKLRSSSVDEVETQRWLKIEMALVIAEATGRRLGSIRHLQWADLDFEKKEIHWRPEFDKKGKDSLVPMPKALLRELKGFRKELGAIGGWLFAAEKNPEVPMDRHLFDKWLAVAEKKAKLPKLRGGLWHCYRRKWATERQHLPTKALMDAGGWSDVDTMMTCYQHTNREMLEKVMNEPTKLRATR